MSIPRTSPGVVNPSQIQPSAILATLQAAALDSQVAHTAALSVLIWFANGKNAQRRFSVTRLTSPEMLNISRKTIYRALELLMDRGYLEERPVRGTSGEREARLMIVAPGGAQ